MRPVNRQRAQAFPSYLACPSTLLADSAFTLPIEFHRFPRIANTPERLPPFDTALS